jgi:hypothetical protein
MVSGGWSHSSRRARSDSRSICRRNHGMCGPARQAYRRNVEWDKWGRDRRSGVKTTEEKLILYSLPMQHLGAGRLGGRWSVRYLNISISRISSKSTRSHQIPEPGGACGAHILYDVTRIQNLHFPAWTLDAWHISEYEQNEVSSKQLRSGFRNISIISRFAQDGHWKH